MGKHLELKGVGQVGVHGSNVGQRHLAGAYHAARAQLVPGKRGGGVGHARLSAHMQVDLGRIALGQGKRPHVRNDERVNPGLLHGLEVRRELLEVALVHHRVARHMHGDPALMGVCAHPRQVLHLEVGGALAHAEALASKVDRIGTEANCILKLFFATRRCQKLHRAHLVLSVSTAQPHLQPAANAHSSRLGSATTRGPQALSLDTPARPSSALLMQPDA